MLISRRESIAYLASIGFALLCIIYFFFVGEISAYPENAVWNRPGNIHDHFVYASYGKDIDNRGFSFLDNNYGMYWLYSWVNDQNKQAAAHIVNVIAILLSSCAYFKICKHFNLPIYSYLTFFLNTSLIYFSILINKDSLSITIFLWTTYFALKKNFPLLILLIIPSLVIRQQVSFFVFMLFIFSFFSLRSKITRIDRIVLYGLGTAAVSATAGAVILRGGGIMSLNSLGDGLTRQLMSIATTWPILAPTTVPPRLLLYAYDMYLSFSFFDSGVIDAARFLRIPTIIYLTYNVIHFRIQEFVSSLKHEGFSILAISSIFAFSAILLNPQINARYATILLPLLTLTVTCYRNRNKWLKKTSHM